MKIWQLSKQAARYRPAPTGEMRCDRCRYMFPPIGLGGCRLVRGLIRSSAICDEFTTPSNPVNHVSARPAKSARNPDQHKVRATAIRSESRVTIASSVPEVWAYVSDVGRWQEWAPTVRECWVDGGSPLQPGSQLEQRAKGLFGSTRHRTQNVTRVEAPRSVAFAGPMGTSAARWGMELEPIGDTQTDAMMWVEVELKNVMRAIPGRVLNGRIQRVMDIEMAAIKAAVESATPG